MNVIMSSSFYNRKLCKLYQQQLLFLQLTIRIIDCTPELVERNRNFVSTHGVPAGNVAMNGSAKIYENKDSSEKVRFILITGKDIQ